MLDTNTVSFVFENKGRVAQRLLSLKPSSICISAITVAELRYGAEKRQSQKLHDLIDRFLAPFTIAPFGEAEAVRYGEVYAVLERNGMPIGELDTQIAAHALALGVTWSQTTIATSIELRGFSSKTGSERGVGCLRVANSDALVMHPQGATCGAPS